MLKLWILTTVLLERSASRNDSTDLLKGQGRLQMSAEKGLKLM